MERDEVEKTGLFFTEMHTPGAGLVLRVTKTLVHKRTKFQELAVLETAEFGRMLVLDGCVMLTERDGFIYHEMLVHPALAFLQGKAESVVVIGGGDGGTVTELVKYPEIKRILLVEIDPEVVAAAREHLPEIAAGLADPRVETCHQDGFQFLKDHEKEFDLILIDSPDPIGPAEALYTEEFYRRAKGALRPGGLLALQSESPWYQRALLKRIYRTLKGLFDHVRVYLAPIPTYPGGVWAFTLASDQELQRNERPLPQELRYLNEEILSQLFALPEYLRHELEGEEG